jgi:putative membrane protein
MKKLLVVVSSVALLAGCARDRHESAGGAERSTTGRESERVTSTITAAPDAQFVQEASRAGAAEVQMGQLLTRNAQSQAVKDFGKRLLDDHTKANQELSRIASSKGYSIASQPNDEQQKMLEHLGTLNGAEFDRVAQKHAIEEHEKAIQLFENAAATCQDPELKSFAQKTLPTLQEHLKLAKGLDVGGTTGTEAQPQAQPQTQPEAQPAPPQK